MKKFINLFIGSLCVLIFAVMSGCSSVKDKDINLVTSFYPIYIMTLNLTDGISNVSVTNMAENHTGCLHDFRLQTSDMKKIEKSDAFIINGAGMESFLDKIIESNPEMTIINSSIGIDIIKSEHSHNHDENEHDDSDEDSEEKMNQNPHIWVSISNYIKQVDNICDGLVKINPESESKYRENALIYKKKLENLRDKMHHELDTLPNKNVITFHDAFPYFAKEFNLNIPTVISSEPENEPSVKELSETINTVKKLGIKALFVEPQYSDSSAKTIAQETGASVYSLDSGSSGEISKNAYLNIMEKNLKVLKDALA